MKNLKTHYLFNIFFVISFLFHALYLYYSGLDLAPDEAHYWEWSRRLGLSYYSKGPLVAYIIRFFTMLLGQSTFSVRFGTVVLAQISLFVIYYLTWKFFNNRTVALLTAIMSQILPLFAAGAVVMTTDPIYIMFWGLAVLSIYRLVKYSNPLYFYLFALCVGLGFLGKYAMLYIYVGFLIYFLSDKKRRVLLNRSHFYISLLLTLVIISPVIIWTIQNDFVNVLHVFHQGKNQSSQSFISIKYFLEFLSGQAGIVTPLLFGLMVWAQIRAFKLPKDHRWKESFDLLTWFGLPVFLISLIMSIKVRIHPNWPAAAYFTILILTAGITYDKYLQLDNLGKIKLVRFLKFVYGLAAFVMILAYNTDGLRWLGVKFLPDRVGNEVILNKPINKIFNFLHNPQKDPTNRLKGWRELGKRIDEIMSKEENIFIFSSQYQIAGEVAFYTNDKYHTYCINLGRRFNQYDIWGGWDKLVGKNAIQVENTKTKIHIKVKNSFEKCEILEYFEAKRWGKVIKDWTIIKCQNFLGLEEEDHIMSY